MWVKYFFLAGNQLCHLNCRRESVPGSFTINDRPGDFCDGTQCWDEDGTDVKSTQLCIGGRCQVNARYKCRTIIEIKKILESSLLHFDRFRFSFLLIVNSKLQITHKCNRLKLQTMRTSGTLLSNGIFISCIVRSYLKSCHFNHLYFIEHVMC